MNTLDSIDSAGGSFIAKITELLLSETMLFTSLLVFLLVYVISHLRFVYSKPHRQRDLLKITFSMVVTPPLFIFFAQGVIEDPLTMRKMALVAASIITGLPYVGLLLLRWKAPKLAEIISPDDKLMRKVKAGDIDPNKTVIIKSDD